MTYGTNIASFGYSSASASFHPNNTNPTTIDSAAHIAEKVWYGNIAHKVTIVALAAIGIFFSGPIALGLLLAVSLLYYAAEAYSRQEICKAAGVVVHDPEQFETMRLIPEFGNCEALPTENSADTELWRKKLIEAARTDITISGNFCGDDSFVQLLDDLEKQLIKKPVLKVVILSSPRFLDEACREKLKSLDTRYSERFSLVECPDIWYISLPKVTPSMNHTKITIIDGGEYFILGGSGIKDNFTTTGVDTETKADFIQTKIAQGFITQDEAPSLPKPKKKSTFLDNIIPRSFRDMDFVFHTGPGENSVGRQAYKQALLLAYRWEQYNKMVKHLPTKPAPANLAAFNGRPSPIELNDSVTMQLMKTPLPHWADTRILTTVPAFDSSRLKANDVSMKVLAQGPEQDKSPFAEELLYRIRTAKGSIAINHMFFHPTDEIMNALIDAANRGVKITIITCGEYENCPRSHHAFGPRNKYNCARLVNSVRPEFKNNIEIYEFQQYRTGHHKKAVIIDNCVIAGSSNLGYKSLEVGADNEVNFVVDNSETFVQRTWAIFNDDILHSVRRTDFSLSTNDYVKTGIHRSIAFLVG